ncbi:unnamed protein product [Rodentolepis nana]|uniref:Uncharacterized protein n=1 Tax=Rodentolepis nana TaxID=102285 RepID=A0A0R3TII1_RODNA|nr:unnamed protein product [Rodentolepis nana]
MRQHVQQQQQQQAQNQALGGSASQVFGSQLQHQTSTRSHGAPQSVINPNNAIVQHKRSTAGEPGESPYYL